MTIPLLLQVFTFAAAVGAAGVLLYLVRAVLLAVHARRARRRLRGGPTADQLLAAVQRHMADSGRQAVADRIGEIRLTAAIHAARPPAQSRRPRRGRS